MHLYLLWTLGGLINSYAYHSTQVPAIWKYTSIYNMYCYGFLSY